MPLARCFKPYTVGTTAQPLIGTTFTALVTGHDDAAQTVAVADSSMFLNSDDVRVYSAAGVFSERVQIQVVTSTSVRGYFTKTHNSGDFLQLSFPCANVTVQAVLAHPVSGASVFIGSTAAVTSAGVAAFYDLGLSLYFEPPAAGWGNPDNTSNYWVCASTGTQYYLPAAWQNAG